MRIQETNQILKEGKLHRLDHERREQEQTGASLVRERLRRIGRAAGDVLRRTDVRAGLSAAGIALVATAGVVLKAQRNKRRGWLHFLR